MLKRLFSPLLASARDLLPIVVVIGFFQLVVLQQPIPNLSELLIGTLFVMIGLALFVKGLEMGLFPIGETMAHAFARKGSEAAASLTNVLVERWLTETGDGEALYRGQVILQVHRDLRRLVLRPQVHVLQIRPRAVRPRGLPVHQHRGHQPVSKRIRSDRISRVFPCRRSR